MLTATQKQAVSTLIAGVRSVLKTETTKGAALRKEMMALASSAALVSFVDDCRTEIKATVTDAKVAARASSLVSVIASQVRKEKGWPKLRAAGAGRKKAADKADEQSEESGKESATDGIIAAVAYIVRRHREISKADLAKFLQPLVPVIRYSAEK